MEIRNAERGVRNGGKDLLRVFAPLRAILFAATVAALWPIASSAQTAPSTGGLDCGPRLREAVARHHHPAVEGGVIHRVYRVVTVLRTANGFDTSETRLEQIHTGKVRGVRTAGAEIWSDSDHIVHLSTAAKVIRISSQRSVRRARMAQEGFNRFFSDSLLDLSTIVACERDREGTMRAILAVDSGARALFNADTLDMTVNAAGDITRFVVISPAWSRRARMEIEEEDEQDAERDEWDSKGEADRSVYARFFDAEGELLPKYDGYVVQKE